GSLVRGDEIDAEPIAPRRQRWDPERQVDRFADRHLGVELARTGFKYSRAVAAVDVVAHMDAMIGPRPQPPCLHRLVVGAHADDLPSIRKPRHARQVEIFEPAATWPGTIFARGPLTEELRRVDAFHSGQPGTVQV